MVYGEFINQTQKGIHGDESTRSNRVDLTIFVIRLNAVKSYGNEYREYLQVRPLPQWY